MFNVQGTTQGSNGFAAAAGVAVTNVALHNGDDRVFLSSNANLDQSSWSNVDFLTGNLDDFRGTLNIDLGAGRHKLFMSDEASSHDDNWTITGNAARQLDLDRARRPDGDQLHVRRRPRRRTSTTASRTGRAPATTRSRSARSRGSRASGRRRRSTRASATTRSRRRSPTAATRSSSRTSPAARRPATRKQHTAARRTTDSFDGSLSTLPLVVFGGFGNDTIRGGSNRDVILGDLGRVQYVDPVTGALLAQFGYGGRGDLISSQILDPMWVYTFVPDLTVGGNDTIYGNGGEDVLIGGAAATRSTAATRTT